MARFSKRLTRHSSKQQEANILITWATDLSDQFKGLSGDWQISAIDFAANLAKTAAKVKWARTSPEGIHRVRFILPDADDKTHDLFINAIYGLDPDAEIRTAKASYFDASDFLSQKAARI